ncbi:unnamed protein product, partial [Brassica rapa subsp. narinosa]
LSHDGLNPAHVPYWWVNNPTLGEFCFTMIGRADIEGSKSNVAMNAWLPQASYPCGNFSDTSSFKFRRSKGSIGHAFTVRHLRYLLTDVPPQPNSPPDNVLRPDRPTEASLGSKRRGCYPASDSRRRGGCFVEPSHGIESSKWAIFGKQNWRCGMNRKPGYGAQLRANLEPTKGVGRLRQQDGGHGKLSFLFNSLPTLETAQPEVGSSGWKSTARRVVSGAFPAALENPEDRVPLTPGRTHNRIRSPRQGKSAKWIRNFGKRIGSEGWARGSQFRTRRLLAGCLSC